MLVLYLILLINCFVETFVRWSKGKLFYKPETKAVFQVIHSIILIILMVVATIKYSWLHIIFMFLVDTIAYMPFALIMKKLIYKE